ncbi:MAG: ROK family protein [Firmicutes bacterium]|nr:ROK family protein [Bacillota bacterium]
MNSIVLGVDIGGTKCAVIFGRVNYSENNIINSIDIIDKAVFPTEAEKGPEQTINRIIKEIDLMMAKQKFQALQFEAIGISCGGPLDSKKGIIMSPPNLYGWDNIKIVEILEKRFGIKTKLQNDANACALAEWKFGAAKGYENIIFLTFGTGMGAGLILNGRLYTGTNDMAGEVGHIRLENNGPVGYGKSGSFEGFCSGGGIAQLAKTRVLEKLQVGKKVSFCNSIDKLNSLDAKIVADAAKEGDELAIEIYKECGRYLGRGLSILIDILNPEIIVIGSIFSRSKDLLWPWAEEVIKKESLVYSREVCKVVPASLGENIGDYAALATALN